MLLLFFAIWDCVKERNRIFAVPKTTNCFKINGSKCTNEQSLNLASWTFFLSKRSASVKCTTVLNRVNLGFFCDYIESLTMSLQERPKKKSKRENGLFCLYSECTCVDVMHFVPVCTSAYHMEKHKTYNGSAP